MEKIQIYNRAKFINLLKYILSIIMSAILVFTFIIPISCNSQSIDWGYSIGGTSEDVCYDVFKDMSGDIYITGGFCNTANFNPGGSPFIVSANGTDSRDVFVAKYNKDFVMKWMFPLGGSAWEQGAKLLIDDSLNIYVIGTGVGIIDFDPTPGTYLFDCAPYNAFIAKYDSSGKIKTVNKINASSAIYQDNQKNIFTFSNDTLCKFDVNLNLLWKKFISGKPELINNNEFYVVKNFKSPIYDLNDYIFDLIIEEYSCLDGLIISSKISGHINGGAIIGGFIKKTKNDKLIVSGKFLGTYSLYGKSDTISLVNTDMESGPNGEQHGVFREFVAMCDTLGNVLWAKAYDAKSPEPYLIETDDNGNIYTLGFLNFDANFDPDHNFILTNNGYGNYIAKYDSNFNYCAASLFLGGSYNDFIGNFKLYQDTALICGNFCNTINLALDGSSYTLSANAPEDIFVAKYSNFNIVTHPAGVNDVLNVNIIFQVFPNPASDFLYIESNLEQANAKVILSNLQGQVCLREPITSSHQKIDVSRLARGMYLATIMGEKINKTFKIVKE